MKKIAPITALILGTAILSSGFAGNANEIDIQRTASSEPISKATETISSVPKFSIIPVDSETQLEVQDVQTRAANKVTIERASLTAEKKPKPKPKPKPAIDEEKLESSTPEAKKPDTTSQKEESNKNKITKANKAKPENRVASPEKDTKIIFNSAKTSKSPREYAKRKLSSKNLGNSEFTCLNKLWNKESGWNYKAENASSGAYGIPQAYPGNKMSSAGADWKTNYETQIDWGLSYIYDRYGTPCGAWGKSQSSGWY